MTLVRVEIFLFRWFEYLRIMSGGRLRFHGGLPGPPPLLLEGLPKAPHAGGLLMLVQVGLEGEGLVAAPADEGLGVGVGLDMRPEVGLVGKGLVANGTSERFLSCKNWQGQFRAKFIPHRVVFTHQCVS